MLLGSIDLHTDPFGMDEDGDREEALLVGQDMEWLDEVGADLTHRTYPVVGLHIPKIVDEQKDLPHSDHLRRNPQTVEALYYQMSQTYHSRLFATAFLVHTESECLVLISEEMEGTEMGAYCWI